MSLCCHFLFDFLLSPKTEPRALPACDPTTFLFSLQTLVRWMPNLTHQLAPLNSPQCRRTRCPFNFPISDIFPKNFDTCRPRRAGHRQSPSMSIQSMTYSVHTQRNHPHQDHNKIMNNQFKTLLTLFPISIHLCSSSFSPSRTVILCSNATPSHELKSPDSELLESSLLLLCLLLCASPSSLLGRHSQNIFAGFVQMRSRRRGWSDGWRRSFCFLLYLSSSSSSLTRYPCRGDQSLPLGRL